MIELSGVSKHYGRIVALSGVTFRIDSGVVGLLGPNGAGKSTILRLVTGFIGPDQGAVTVMGANPLLSSTRRLIGYLPEGAPLPPDATVLEILDFATRCRNISRVDRTAAIKRVSERLNLGSFRSRIAERLSKGQRRRVALACALIDDPPILVLDEPTDGLDPNQRAEVHALIREMSTSRTILISTHILEEADQLCQRGLILASGRLLIDGALRDISRKSRHYGAVHLDLLPEANVDEIVTAIRELPTVYDIELDPIRRRVTALPRPGENPFHAIASLVATFNWPIEGLHREAGRLDEVFRALTADQSVA